MFFLVPYAVDVPFDRKPVLNWLLVISVIAVFILQYAAYTGTEESYFDSYVLNGWNWRGLIGHMWLHADPIHLGGNMLFLWVFGNAVCAKVGNLKYLPIFLFLGLGAAAAHLWLNGSPAIGASGAVNGIVGMFLVFFWQNEMDCVFFILIVLRPIYKTFSVSSYWMILLWLVFDIIGALIGEGQTAYYAHLGGFFSGAILAVVLLKLKLVTMYRDEQSLVGFVESWIQRRRDSRLEKIAHAEIEKVRNRERTEQSPEPAVDTADSKIHFMCQCGQRFSLQTKNAGRKGQCPKCRQPLTVPTPGSFGDA
jgi:membrane associated rhomboid family serine protease